MNHLEILGMNSRNIDYIYTQNDRHLFHLVDNKLETKILLEDAGLPTPKLICSCEWFWEIENMVNTLQNYSTFVIKPARGMAGGGIIIVNEKSENGWITASGREISSQDITDHARDILYGTYSIDSTTDTVIIEEKIIQHNFFNTIYSGGVADVRVIVFKGEPAMAMCRIPTKKSDGKANISLGAIGAGVDLETGRITKAVTKKGELTLHPDSKAEFVGLTIPYWSDVLDISRKIQHIFPLGFLGLDIVIDENRGPLILELNARPGLEIQNANGYGLKSVLEKIEFEK
jgi:alpha-L-glutamate ligase-like protein